MDLFETIKQRHSIRTYQKRDIEEDKLQRVFGAIGAAPSAGNLQAYNVVAVRNSDKKHELAVASCNQMFLEQAPIVLVFLASSERNRNRYGKRGENLFSIQDATIACSYAQLAATSLGLGSCWIGSFNEKVVADIVGASNQMRVVALLPLGYADESPSIRPRREIIDLVFFESVK
jgi:nitroreductase